MKKYGKPIEPLLDHKQHFWNENDQELEKRKRVAEVYTSQPIRDTCKICSEVLNDSDPSFKKMGVEYVLCHRCGQLNGIHEETQEFTDYLYTGTDEDENEESVDYAEEYTKEDKETYKSRLETIYEPKVEFLFDALREESAPPSERAYADFGAGAGYMMAALQGAGAQTVSGFEVSAEQVKFAKQMNNNIDIEKISAPDIYHIAGTTDAEVITMIGVIEHLREPVKILQSIAENPSVEYVFCTFPLFSPSVFFEMCFPEVMPRHLTLGHTHLFQESSINWICDKVGFERKSEWWFGQDIIDLVRSVEVTVQQQTASQEIKNEWSNMMYDAVDELQQTLDEKQNSSSVHMLLKT